MADDRYVSEGMGVVINFRRKSTVIILDDNEDDIFLIRHAFSNFSGNIISVRTADELFQCLGVFHDTGWKGGEVLVLLDINMPKQNGFQVLARLKSDSRYSDLTILMLSSSDAVSDVYEALALGSDGYIEKPFTMAKLDRSLRCLPPQASWTAIVGS